MNSDIHELGGTTSKSDASKESTNSSSRVSSSEEMFPEYDEEKICVHGRESQEMPEMDHSGAKMPIHSTDLTADVSVCFWNNSFIAPPDKDTPRPNPSGNPSDVPEEMVADRVVKKLVALSDIAGLKIVPGIGEYVPYGPPTTQVSEILKKSCRLKIYVCHAKIDKEGKPIVTALITGTSEDSVTWKDFNNVSIDGYCAKLRGLGDEKVPLALIICSCVSHHLAARLVEYVPCVISLISGEHGELKKGFAYDFVGNFLQNVMAYGYDVEKAFEESKKDLKENKALWPILWHQKRYDPSKIILNPMKRFGVPSTGPRITLRARESVAKRLLETFKDMLNERHSHQMAIIGPNCVGKTYACAQLAYDIAFSSNTKALLIDSKLDKKQHDIVIYWYDFKGGDKSEWAKELDEKGPEMLANKRHIIICNHVTSADAFNKKFGYPDELQAGENSRPVFVICAADKKVASDLCIAHVEELDYWDQESIVQLVNHLKKKEEGQTVYLGRRGVEIAHQCDGIPLIPKLNLEKLDTVLDPTSDEIKNRLRDAINRLDEKEKELLFTLVAFNSKGPLPRKIVTEVYRDSSVIDGLTRLEQLFFIKSGKEIEFNTVVLHNLWQIANKSDQDWDADKWHKSYVNHCKSMLSPSNTQPEWWNLPPYYRTTLPHHMLRSGLKADVLQLLMSYRWGDKAIGPVIASDVKALHAVCESDISDLIRFPLPPVGIGIEDWISKNCREPVKEGQSVQRLLIEHQVGDSPALYVVDVLKDVLEESKVNFKVLEDINDTDSFDGNTVLVLTGYFVLEKLQSFLKRCDNPAIIITQQRDISSNIQQRDMSSKIADHWRVIKVELPDREEVEHYYLMGVIKYAEIANPDEAARVVPPPYLYALCDRRREYILMLLKQKWPMKFTREEISGWYKNLNLQSKIELHLDAPHQKLLQIMASVDCTGFPEVILEKIQLKDGDDIDNKFNEKIIESLSHRGYLSRSSTLQYSDYTQRYGDCLSIPPIFASQLNGNHKHISDREECAERVLNAILALGPDDDPGIRAVFKKESLSQLLRAWIADHIVAILRCVSKETRDKHLGQVFLYPYWLVARCQNEAAASTAAEMKAAAREEGDAARKEGEKEKSKYLGFCSNEVVNDYALVLGNVFLKVPDDMPSRIHPVPTRVTGENEKWPFCEQIYRVLRLQWDRLVHRPSEIGWHILRLLVTFVDSKQFQDGVETFKGDVFYTFGKALDEEYAKEDEKYVSNLLCLFSNSANLKGPRRSLMSASKTSLSGRRNTDGGDDAQPDDEPLRNFLIPLFYDYVEHTGFSPFPLLRINSLMMQFERENVDVWSAIYDHGELSIPHASSGYITSISVQSIGAGAGVLVICGTDEQPTCVKFFLITDPVDPRIAERPAHWGRATSVVISKNGLYAASAGVKPQLGSHGDLYPTLRAWNLDRVFSVREMRMRGEPHRETVSSVMTCEYNHKMYIISGSLDRSVKIWEKVADKFILVGTITVSFAVIDLALMSTKEGDVVIVAIGTKRFVCLDPISSLERDCYYDHYNEPESSSMNGIDGGTTTEDGSRLLLFFEQCITVWTVEGDERQLICHRNHFCPNTTRENRVRVATQFLSTLKSIKLDDTADLVVAGGFFHLHVFRLEKNNVLSLIRDMYVSDFQISSLALFRVAKESDETRITRYYAVTGSRSDIKVWSLPTEGAVSQLDVSLDLSGSLHVILPSADAFNFNNSSFTIAFWITPKQEHVNPGYLISKDGGYSVYLQNGRIVVELPGFGKYTSEAAIHNGARNCVVLVVYAIEGTASTCVEFWFDGVLNGAVALEGHNVSYETTPVYMGSTPDPISNHFNGFMDEVRFWNTRLSEDDVASFYNAGLGDDNNTIKPDKIVALYHCADGSGVKLTDSGGNELTGTLSCDSWKRNSLFGWFDRPTSASCVLPDSQELLCVCYDRLSETRTKLAYLHLDRKCMLEKYHSNKECTHDRSTACDEDNLPGLEEALMSHTIMRLAVVKGNGGKLWVIAASDRGLLILLWLAVTKMTIDENGRERVSETKWCKHQVDGVHIDQVSCIRDLGYNRIATVSWDSRLVIWEIREPSDGELGGAVLKPIVQSTYKHDQEFYEQCHTIPISDLDVYRPSSVNDHECDMRILLTCGTTAKLWLFMPATDDCDVVLFVFAQFGQRVPLEFLLRTEEKCYCLSPEVLSRAEDIRNRVIEMGSFDMRLRAACFAVDSLRNDVICTGNEAGQIAIWNYNVTNSAQAAAKRYLDTGKIEPDIIEYDPHKEKRVKILAGRYGGGKSRCWVRSLCPELPGRVFVAFGFGGIMLCDFEEETILSSFWNQCPIQRMHPVRNAMTDRIDALVLISKGGYVRVIPRVHLLKQPKTQTRLYHVKIKSGPKNIPRPAIRQHELADLLLQFVSGTEDDVIETVSHVKFSDDRDCQMLLLVDNPDHALEVAQKLRNSLEEQKRSSDVVLTILGGMTVGTSLHRVSLISPDEEKMELEIGAHARIVVATPSRVLDVIQWSALRVNSVNWYILLGADRLLTAGYLDQIKWIADKMPFWTRMLVHKCEDTVPGYVIDELVNHFRLIRDRKPPRIDTTELRNQVDNWNKESIHGDGSASPTKRSTLKCMTPKLRRSLTDCRFDHILPLEVPLSDDQILRGLGHLCEEYENDPETPTILPNTILMKRVYHLEDIPILLQIVEDMSQELVALLKGGGNRFIASHWKCKDAASHGKSENDSFSCILLDPMALVDEMNTLDAVAKEILQVLVSSKPESTKPKPIKLRRKCKGIGMSGVFSCFFVLEMALDKDISSAKEEDILSSVKDEDITDELLEGCLRAILSES